MDVVLDVIQVILSAVTLILLIKVMRDNKQ